MATDVERLVVSLEASITKYERAMQRALGQTNQTARRIEQRFDRTAKTLDQRFSAAGTAMSVGLAKAFAGAAALRGAQQLIDTSTRIENSLKVAGLAGEDLARVYDSLFASAQRNAAPLESLVTLYGRAAIVQKELGVSTEELLGFTDNVAVALRVAGTDASTASGALLQLSQALGAGTVRAEEFNSILEGALPIAQAAAAGLEEAGGSVAKLRALVVDGKVSSEAFFRAFEAGSSILTDKVANAEMTVAQGFVRLQNVLIDVAGKFDENTGAASSFAGTLDAVAGALERMQGSNILSWLGNLNGFLESSSFLQFEGSLREIERILTLVDQGAGMVAGSFDGAADSIEQALAWALGFQEVADAPVALQENIKLLAQTVVDGTTDADELRASLTALGAAPVNMAIQIADIMALGEAARIARGEIDALNSGPAANGIALQRSEQGFMKPKVVPKPVSIADYPAAPSGGGSGGGRGGGGKPAGDRFAEALAAQERETASLQRKTSLLAQLNPLVNDYGYAVERLNAQMELENAATQAGLALTPERQAQIALLSEGYAQATSEAVRLAEAQDKAKESAVALAQAGRDALDSIVDGFLEGKNAADIFGSALQDLGKSLIKMGINSVLGGIGGGGNIFAGLFGGKGFATGTANTGGRRGEPRGLVHGQEAVIPLPNGGRVPVDIRMPKLPTAAAMAGGEILVRATLQVIGGNLVPVITQVSGQVAGQQIKANNRQLPNLMSDYQMRQG